MNQAASRIGAIVRADFLIRFRRLSTLVVFLLICFFAYLWIPDLSTGRTLLQINGQRALYNSAALGMATASIGSIFIGLAGFYVVSNAIGRDVSTRCGAILASTGVRTGEYLFGKFLGNVVFLSVFLFGFMLSSMVMLLIRSEAPLEMGTFVGQYLLLAPPGVVFVSAVAVLFESVRFLSGRFGDVVYFVLWAVSLGVVATASQNGTARWPRYVDHHGFVFMMDQLRGESETPSVSIGATSFDPTQPPLVFQGLRLTPEWIGPRIVSTLSPLMLLLMARLFFHRFDPSRIRMGGPKRGRGLMAGAAGLSRPLSRIVGLLRLRSGARSLTGQAWEDALRTLALTPLAIVAVLALGVASFIVPASLRTGVFPFALAAAGILLADVASRDWRAGTLPLIYASPRLRESFVLWKAASMLLTAVVCLGAPVLMIGRTQPEAIWPLAVGVFFTVALANFLGIVSRNPKTFIVLFLSFWYLMLNDKGATPGLDFAGVFGTATPAVTASYAVAAGVALLLAHVIHRRRRGMD